MVNAAAPLFADRGPAAVSLRDVAEAAGVNLGLIHRYIGSKEDLIALVLARLWPTSQFTRDPEDYLLRFLKRNVPAEVHLRVLMRVALDGYDLRRLEPKAPNLRGFARAMSARMDPVDADVRTALATSMILGWLVMGPTVLELLGRGRISESALEAAVRPAVEAMLGP